MRFNRIAVALAAMSIAGAAVAAGNDTSTTTSGAANHQSSGAKAGTSASDQSWGQQAGTSANDQSAQRGSQDASASGMSPNGSASSEQTNPDLVRSAQQALKDKGFDVGTVDGQIGPNTQSALRNFQQAQGLPQSGNLDQQTLSALGVDHNQASSGQAAMSSQGATSSEGSQSQGSQSQGAMQSHDSATRTSGSYK